MTVEVRKTYSVPKGGTDEETSFVEYEAFNSSEDDVTKHVSPRSYL